MQTLKAIIYVVLAVILLAGLLFAGGVLVTLLVVGSAVGTILLVVFLTARALRDYFESG